jgi:hypothetical protein
MYNKAATCVTSTAEVSFGTFEKVKLYKAWHLVEMIVARQPDLLEAGFPPVSLVTLIRVHCDNCEPHCPAPELKELMKGVRHEYLQE